MSGVEMIALSAILGLVGGIAGALWGPWVIEMPGVLWHNAKVWRHNRAHRGDSWPTALSAGSIGLDASSVAVGPRHDA